MVEALRRMGEASVAACSNATASPPRTALCISGVARTFATPFMLENHLNMLLRPLVGDSHSTHARLFTYMKLLDRSTEVDDLASLTSAMEGTWLRPMLAEVAILNGSGSYAGTGWRAGIDSIGSLPVYPTDMERSVQLRPNASRCKGPFNGTYEDWQHETLTRPYVATEWALGLRWCADAIVRFEKRVQRQFDVVAYVRPDQLFMKALPPWCTWPWHNQTLACQAGGSDGVWVAPRAHAMQMLNVVQRHQRGSCVDLSPSFQCAHDQQGANHPVNCPHGRRLHSPLRPSCCGPQEYLISEMLHAPRPLALYADSCRAVHGIAFNYLRRAELTPPSKFNHTCQVALGLPISHYFDRTPTTKTWVLHWFDEMHRDARLEVGTAQHLRSLFNASAGAIPRREAEDRCRQAMARFSRSKTKINLSA